MLPRSRNCAVAKNPQRLDRGREPALHVARPAAAEQFPFDSRRNERQVNDVEMAVELEAFPRLSGIETDNDCGGRRMLRGFSLYCEPVVVEETRESVENGPGIPGRRWNRDQPRCRVEQSIATHVGADQIEHG